MGDLKSHHGSVLQCFFVASAAQWAVVASAAQWAVNASHLHPQRSDPPACRTVLRIMCHVLRELDGAHEFVACLICIFRDMASAAQPCGMFRRLRRQAAHALWVR